MKTILYGAVALILLGSVLAERGLCGGHRRLWLRVRQLQDLPPGVRNQESSRHHLRVQVRGLLRAWSQRLLRDLR